MTAETIDYGDSRIRTALTWLVYPVCVVLPFTWLVSNLNVDEPLKLHRWHHSSMIRHSNINLIIFDVLFGTRCLLSQGQNIKEMGLGEHDAFFAQAWWQQLLVPFHWKAMLKLEEETITNVESG